MSLEIRDTFEDLLTAMKRQVNHSKIEEINFYKENEQQKDVPLSKKEHSELSKIVLNSFLKIYPRIKKVYFALTSATLSEEGKEIQDILAKRNRPINVPEKCTELEKEFSEVKEESKDGFLFLKEKEIMKSLDLTEEQLKEVIDYGIKENIFKRSMKDGENIICYIKGGRTFEATEI